MGSLGVSFCTLIFKGGGYLLMSFCPDVFKGGCGCCQRWMRCLWSFEVNLCNSCIGLHYQVKQVRKRIAILINIKEKPLVPWRCLFAPWFSKWMRSLWRFEVNMCMVTWRCFFAPMFSKVDAVPLMLWCRLVQLLHWFACAAWISKEKDSKLL